LVIERVIGATTHGRFLVEPPATAGAAPMLVGFHGYGEGAATQLDRMRAIPGSERWLLVSIQGLHRFYDRRTNEVVASWMTRQDRDLTIADNLAFVDGVIAQAARDWPVSEGLVFTGFSQGVAMTFRAAANATRRVAGLIAAGGDVPPEIAPDTLRRVTAALLCRGTGDAWYTAEKFADDTRRIRTAGADVRAVEFEGGHEWSADVIQAASVFLRERR
jgi:predicted esterase